MNQRLTRFGVAAAPLKSMAELEGRKLEPTRYAGFARYDGAALMALGTWLGL